MNFQKAFERLLKVKEDATLTSEVGSSDTRWGEGPSKKGDTISLKPSLEFSIQDESDDEVQVLFISIPSEGDEDVEYISNVVVGIQAPRKFPAKTLSEEERRIWSTITWASSLGDVLERSRELERVKTKLTIDAFLATQSMMHVIPSPRVVPIDEGSPLWKRDDIPEEPLIPPPPKFTIKENI